MTICLADPGVTCSGTPEMSSVDTTIFFRSIATNARQPILLLLPVCLRRLFFHRVQNVRRRCVLPPFPPLFCL